MERDRRLSLMVGGFVIATLAGLAMAVLLLSSDRGIFTPQYRLIARFSNVQGLISGAPVWLAGKEVGRVESVSFSDESPDAPLRAVLRIERKVQDRIRENSVASIGTIGLLGDSYIEISVGSPDQEILPDDGEIRTVSPASLGDVVAKGTRALDSIAELADNVNTVVENFAEGKGGARAAEAVSAVSDMILAVKDRGGLLHSLIYDQYSGKGVESLERLLATLDDILAEVRTGEGLLHTLIYEPTTEQDLVRDTLQAGARLNNILAKVDSGEGTLGLLLNDPTLYEELVTLVGGAKESLVVRSLLRMAVEAEDSK
jgi:phospholipid/cholesterol/gamma-HCH transport system substrate-binding protein